MFEFHGWANIRFTAENRDRNDEEELQNAAVESVRTFIGQLGYDPFGKGNVVLSMRPMNGETLLWTAGHKNRPTTVGQEILELYAYVARVAPGSYGLLYTYDDEDLTHANVFRAYVLARGQFTERADPFLSPYVPVIEDPPGEA